LSDVFFDELEIPRPDIHLEIGSGPHGAQTGRMLEAVESALQEKKPDMVVVYGDTNSTAAGALAAAKLHIPIAHIEAGLRSFNRAMPEEINRLVADHISDLLLAPTKTAMKNLSNENLSDRSFNTGDVMLDAVRFNSRLAEINSEILARHGLKSGEYAVATLHRPVNTDAGNLVRVLDILAEIATNTIPVVFPAHPRTFAILKAGDIAWDRPDQLKLIEPVGYLDMLKLLRHARIVLTDSGGLQKEALFLETPCVTLREETEWIETIDAGGNVLTGSNRDKVLEAVDLWLTNKVPKPSSGSVDTMPFGDGAAAEKIVDRILEFHAERTG
jgi:UDP-N-acetylglucosamine 2-epimerase